MKKILVLMIVLSMLTIGCESQAKLESANETIYYELFDYSNDLIYEAESLKAIGFDDRDAQRERWDNNPVSEETYGNINHFNGLAIESMMTTYDPSENLVFSPLNLYFALGLIQEGAEGETKDQITKLININELDSSLFNNELGNLYRQLSMDNEIGKLHISNSLWLDKDFSFKDDFISKLGSYYADLFTADFKSDKLKGKINYWIEDHTNGLLHYDNDIREDEILKVISTLYFYDEWVDRFDESLTAKDRFYLSKKEYVEVDFMNMTYGAKSFRRNEYFQSTHLSMKNHFGMDLYLPNEGIIVEEMLTDSEILASILDKSSAMNSEDRYYGEVIIKLPKFSFGSDLGLKESLKHMGVENIFKSEADFSGISDSDLLFVGDVVQNSHIAIDEVGVEAASFTQILYFGSGLPEDKCELILDRPFVFTISNGRGVCLYVGIVNNPLIE
ncbi:serpin family protein [Acidaminobacter sp. JC074]|uniref:serpin family protein n=1 Tax=Acidaminobacter sp. JC074 TaxID=2530199 RepID=UPI001F10C25E|nr:serpin family protein [Acidaminobacter sp. JC074]